MIILKRFTVWIFLLAFVLVMPNTVLAVSALTPAPSTGITDFTPLQPVMISADTAVSLEETQLWLFTQFPFVGVNENTGTIPVARWELNESRVPDFEARVSGTYLFTAVLGVSGQYDTITVLLPLPTISVILLPGMSTVQSIYAFDIMEDLAVPTEKAEELGFATLEEAQATLLEKYGSIWVNDGEFQVEIAEWLFTGEVTWTADKYGEYFFEGVIADPDLYLVECAELPQIKVILTKTEKLRIESLSEFSPISISSANPTGYRTEAEAIKTLNSMYTSVKVNGGNDVVPVSGWRRTDTKVYDTAENEVYTFIAELGQSEKYDTATLSCAWPALQLIFCAPNSYVSITVTDETDKPIRFTPVCLSNEEKILYAYTNANGICNFYNVAGGSYTISITNKNLEYTRAVTVRTGYSSILTWKISSEMTPQYTETDVMPTEVTTTKAAVTSITEPPLSAMEELAEQLQRELAYGDPSSVLLLDSTAENGTRARIYPGEMTETERKTVQEMSLSSLAEEMKKALSAVARMNFSGYAVKARNAILNAASGTSAMILPIHFSTHLDFVFPLTITLDTLEEDLGFEEGACYLYYYNSTTGELEDCKAASTNGKGSFTFTISHCSDYFLLNFPLGKAAATAQTDSVLSVNATDAPPGLPMAISQGPAGNNSLRSEKPTFIKIGNNEREGFSFTPAVLAGGFVMILIVSMIFRRQRAGKMKE